MSIDKINYGDAHSKFANVAEEYARKHPEEIDQLVKNEIAYDQNGVIPSTPHREIVPHELRPTEKQSLRELLMGKPKPKPVTDHPTTQNPDRGNWLQSRKVGMIYRTRLPGGGIGFSRHPIGRKRH
jgi:hypothetical protein